MGSLCYSCCQEEAGKEGICSTVTWVTEEQMEYLYCIKITRPTYLLKHRDLTAIAVDNSQRCL